MLSLVHVYITRLRNEARRDYAIKFLRWALEDKINELPAKGSLSQSEARVIRDTIKKLLES